MGRPPVTGSMAPEMKVASSEARNMYAGATSAGRAATWTHLRRGGPGQEEHAFDVGAEGYVRLTQA
jgi:hypothetical protein